MNPKRPLIFVPGIRTSKLSFKNDDRRSEHFWPLMPHEFMVREKLDRVFQYLDTKIREKPDDYVPVEATGLIPMAYDGLIRSILAWGYKPNIDFWIFPYDWRQSNDISGQQLATFMEAKMQSKWDTGFDIVGHSMGGLITRAAYRKGAPINRVAYVACPHSGSPLAYFILHAEIDSQQFMGASSFQLPHVPFSGWKSNESSAGSGAGKTLYQRRKELFVKFPSIYELLPDENYLRARPLLFADDKPIFGTDDTYFNGDWAFKPHDMQVYIKNAMNFKREISEGILGIKDKNLLFICGTDKVTCDTIRYQTYYRVSETQRMPSYVMQQGFSAPYDSGQHGDGWVPLTSATAYSPGLQMNSNTVFVPQTHAILPNEKTAIEAIGRFLAG